MGIGTANLSGPVGRWEWLSDCMYKFIRNIPFMSNDSPLSVIAPVRGGHHPVALPQLHYERRLNPRRDDQEREHDDEVPPEGMLYMDS